MICYVCEKKASVKLKNRAYYKNTKYELNFEIFYCGKCWNKTVDERTGDE